MSEQVLLVVTPEQYGEGYLEKEGFVAFSRRFELVRRLEDGNYLVKDPQAKIEEKRKREARDAADRAAARWAAAQRARG